MLGKTVLLYTGDRASARRLVGFLRASGSDVVQPKTTWEALEIIAAAAVDLVLVDYTSGSKTLELIDACHELPCVVMADTNDSDTLLDLVCAHNVGHVMGTGAVGSGMRQVDARQITVTIEKILRADVFGIEKYVDTFGADVSTLQITDAELRDEVVENIQDYAKWLGCGRDMCNRITTVADELITNAVYNAPRDEHGQPRYASTNRREKIALDPWEYVQVRFASDGQVFALSVTDWFGGLSVNVVRKLLTRCLSNENQIEQKAGGAGIGMYTAFRAANQLIINVEQAERTEIIAVFELGDRMRGDKLAGHSLQLFTDESMELAAGSSDCIPSIMVSESLQLDLRSAFKQSKPAPFVPLTHAMMVSSTFEEEEEEWDEPTVTVEAPPEMLAQA